MALYTPESKETDFYYNTNDNVPRVIWNSGYLINESRIAHYQKLMQNAVGDSFRDFIRAYGIVHEQE